MDIRAVTEFDTYAFATDQFKIFGMTKEDMVFLVTPLVLGTHWTGNQIVGALAGAISLWLFKVASKGQPDDFILLAVSNILNRLAYGDISQKYPFVGFFFTPIAIFVNRMWIRCGLLPSFYCNSIYER